MAMCLLAAGGPVFPGAQEARVLRFPAVSGTQIVFSYAGDLYTVRSPAASPASSRAHEGYEAFARFSPDGKSIAFTGEYDGNREVYLIPAEGGAPKRLTYTPTLGRDDISDRMGPNNIVMGWTHDGKRIVYRSRMREWNDFNGQLYFASPAGGTPDQLPLPRGGFCSFSPDDTKLAYNRVFREFRTWKRYRGGMADDIWVYDFATKKIENITNNPALDIIPMWSGDQIYFISDRDDAKRMNLYVYNLKTKQTRQADGLRRIRHQIPVARPQAYRLRERRLSSTSSTWPPRRRKKSRSSSPTTCSPAGASWPRSASKSRTRRLPPTESGPCSAPGATSLPCPRNTATRAT